MQTDYNGLSSYTCTGICTCVIKHDTYNDLDTETVLLAIELFIYFKNLLNAFYINVIAKLF